MSHTDADGGAAGAGGGSFCDICYHRGAMELKPFQTVRDGIWFACMPSCYQQLMAHETKIVAVLPKFVFCVTYARQRTPRGHVESCDDTSSDGDDGDDDDRDDADKTPTSLPQPPHPPPQRRPVPPALQQMVSRFVPTVQSWHNTLIHRLTFDTRHELVTWYLYARPADVRFESYGLYLSSVWSDEDRSMWLCTGTLDGTTREGPDRHGVCMCIESTYDDMLELYDLGKRNIWFRHTPRWFITEKIRQARRAFIATHMRRRKRKHHDAIDAGAEEPEAAAAAASGHAFETAIRDKRLRRTQII